MATILFLTTRHTSVPQAGSLIVKARKAFPYMISTAPTKGTGGVFQARPRPA